MIMDSGSEGVSILFFILLMLICGLDSSLFGHFDNIDVEGLLHLPAQPCSHEGYHDTVMDSGSEGVFILFFILLMLICVLDSSLFGHFDDNKKCAIDVEGFLHQPENNTQLCSPKDDLDMVMDSGALDKQSGTHKLTSRCKPFLLLPTLSAATRKLYKTVDPSIIDELAQNYHRPTDHLPLPAQGKRPREQLQPPVTAQSQAGGDISLSDADDNSDESSEEKISGQHPPKRTKLAHDNEQNAAGNGKLYCRKKLDTPIDWNDHEWETQKLPADLLQSIECCKKTKSTRPWSDPCPVLSLFKEIGWSDALKCLFCIVHARLVPGDSFRSHFGGRLHPGAIPGSTRYMFFTASAFHLVECYPDIEHQSYEKLKSRLPYQLQEPLPLKGDGLLQPRYKCPADACSTWVAVTKKKGAPDTELRRHIKMVHNQILDNFPPVSPQLTQQVAVGSGLKLNGSYHCFTILDAHQYPTQHVYDPVFSTPNLAAPSTDKWAESLGWEAYVHEIAIKLGSRLKAVEKLRDLVSLPNLRRISTCTGSSKALEHGLFISNKLNLSYLEDAAIWVSRMPPSVCLHFRHGG